MAALVVLVFLYIAALPAVLSQLMPLPSPWRTALSLALVLPLGFLMGVPLPRGLRWLGEANPSLLPLAWGVNGFASVLGAIVAAMIALSSGSNLVLASGALFYAIGLLALVSRRAPA